MPDQMPPESLAPDESDDAYSDPAPDAGLSHDEPVRHSLRLPGPGLPESVLWAGSIIVLQLVATFPVLYLLTRWWDLDLGDIDKALEAIGPDGRMLVLGLPTLLGFVVLVPLILLRLGRRPTATLNMSWPSLPQLAIVASTVLPLSIVADGLYSFADEQWQALARETGILEFLNGASVTEALETQTKGASVMLMLVFIAVVPAIGEEFVFRGLIGRGLVARWGVVLGVALTSVMFAAVHVYPPHVMAILPVGLVIHLVYLATRSFWMPMLFHFLNNASAVLVLSSGMPMESEPQPLMMAGAIVYVLVALGLLWRFRTQYRGGDGETFSPPYVTVAEPVAESGYVRTSPQSVAATIVFGLLFAVQVGMLVGEVVGSG